MTDETTTQVNEYASANQLRRKAIEALQAMINEGIRLRAPLLEQYEAASADPDELRGALKASDLSKSLSSVDWYVSSASEALQAITRRR